MPRRRVLSAGWLRPNPAVPTARRLRRPGLNPLTTQVPHRCLRQFCRTRINDANAFVPEPSGTAPKRASMASSLPAPSGS